MIAAHRLGQTKGVLIKRAFRDSLGDKITKLHAASASGRVKVEQQHIPAAGILKGRA